MPNRDASHSPVTRFDPLYPQSLCFGHDHPVMIIGGTMNEDGLVDSELCLHHNGALKRLQYRTATPNTLHYPLTQEHKNTRYLNLFPVQWFP